MYILIQGCINDTAANGVNMLLLLSKIKPKNAGLRFVISNAIFVLVLQMDLQQLYCSVAPRQSKGDGPICSLSLSLTAEMLMTQIAAVA